MATWPTTLPPMPLRDGYEITFGNPTIRTDMESGPARVRRRSRASPDKIPLQFLLTEAQMATFRAWFDADIQQGAAWFICPIKDGRQTGVVPKEVRIEGGSLKSAPEGQGWRLSFQVETR